MLVDQVSIDNKASKGIANANNSGRIKGNSEAKARSLRLIKVSPLVES